MKAMEINGSIMETTCSQLQSHDIRWKYMEVNVNAKKSIEVNRNQWKLHENQWKAMNRCSNRWTYM